MKIKCANDRCGRLIELSVDKFLRIHGKIFCDKDCNIAFNSVPLKSQSKKQEHHLTWKYQD